MDHRFLFVLANLSLTAAMAQSADPCTMTGGRTALERLLEQEMHYPAEALEAGIKGEVVVGATLEANGTLKQLTIGNSLSYECDQEALRLVRMVIWQPVVAGADCSVKEHYLSVPFDPAKYKRWAKARHKAEGDPFALPVDTSMVVRTAKDLDSQVEPSITRGMAGLPTYLAQELRYPPEAFRYSLEGTVKLEFVVEPSGSLSNMHALQDVGGGCTEEAMRLMYRIPWKPGVKHGQRVRSSIQVIIRFSLPKQAR